MPITEVKKRLLRELCFSHYLPRACCHSFILRPSRFYGRANYDYCCKLKTVKDKSRVLEQVFLWVKSKKCLHLVVIA